MKIHPISITFIFIVAYALIPFSFINTAYSQGFNNNEWIFGYCEDGENNYVSFGKDGEAKVKNIPAGITFGKGNSAMAIDPITGKTLFYTDGALVYNYLNQPMQGIEGELGGIETERQSVAISELDYSTEEGADKLFYIFFLNRTGELEYAVADMNDQGGAQMNQPPAGAISPGETLGPASGAIAVVKTSGSPNYLISFEEGNLVAREIGATEGEFLITGDLPLDINPKAIVFDEDSQNLIIVPTEPNQDLIQIPFDTSEGSFGTSVPLSQTGGGDLIEGAAFSPDSAYVYYSQGDQLFRIPSSEPSETPEEIPLENDLYKVYDVKTGPDGQIYYIYEETEGGPQLVGRVTNPDEEDLDLIELEEDPFNGTDFCGRVFPAFAPNIDLDNEVDFSWEPMDPCMNNPLQLTSEITPANYQPVSFEWTINPPLTDEEGEEIEVDLDEEHLLLPANATSEENVSVTLTVTFANGDTRVANHNITLTENDLQAQFSASDTTLCEPECIDLMEILEVQSGEEQGGGQGGGIPGLPGGGGQGGGIPGLPGGGQQGGGQQGGNYEYFWSNKKEEGWGPEASNEVCLPGPYWVLVREQGSTCYVYASIRVKIWDIEDQSNNIWYFGDGAGLDFNIDPDDPEGPTPRPIENPHPQDIPAGVTTVSDQAGEVLFYTDGQTVWDLNGNPMQNGENIGGDNQSSQSVLAIPLPQEETLFYLFTTQQSTSGDNEVNFSLVDIKGENPDGVGNVVSSNNFLFSPSTEHSAALGSGDTTWVAFHELGNNTFRFYPVSADGIGQPVFSSVGSNHDFGTGVGSMKFSPDGTKLAVTINEGGTNRVEIFDFDQATGEMTEYALLDLGNQGDIYGLEFSSDGSRVFVSYQDGGPVEEFFIQAPEPSDDTDPDEPAPTNCPDCFENADTREEIEQCILDSRSTVPDTQGLPLGALQIGPNGQIYAAVVGSDLIGQIQVGQDCNPSSFNQNAVEPMPGPSNLGLPSFVQNSGSNVPDPSLSGPDRLCLDPEEGAVGVFEGGGEPDVDTYFWTITDEADSVVHSSSGLGEEFQSLEYNFPSDGLYTVGLQVDRCGTLWEEEFSLDVEVYDTPRIILPSDIPLCSEDPIELTAVDPDDPEIDNFTFVWVNAEGDTLGNDNIISVTEESIYTVTVAYAVPEGADTELFQTCPSTQSVFVGPAFEFEVDQTSEDVCLGEMVTFSPDTPVSGEWFALLEGATERISLGEFFELELVTDDLPEPGDYEILFRTADPLDSTCTVEKTMELKVNPLPAYEIHNVTPAEDCDTPNGSLDIIARTNIDSLVIKETEEVYSLTENESLSLNDLAVGTYTLQAINNGCEYSHMIVIRNENPPADMGYRVTGIPATCGPEGLEGGEIEINFTDGPTSGSYVITREQDGSEFSDTFTTESSLTIDLPPGMYKVNILDENGCPNPNSTSFILDPVEEAEFSIPSEASACDAYTFTPVTSQELIFTLIDEDGISSSPSADGSFTINNEGTYTILGEGADPEDSICPSEKTMTVTFPESVSFELIPPDNFCELPLIYEADHLGEDPESVVIRWLDENGQRVGNGTTFIPDSPGDYVLEVLPLGIVDCPSNQLPFQVPEIASPISVNLNFTPFCAEDAFSTLSFEADLTIVETIQWFFMENGTFEPIPNTEDQENISVSDEGTYQVVLLDSFGCEIGREEVNIARSVTDPPVLEENYTICPIENVNITLNPGMFDTYEWVLEEEVIGSGANFTPTLPGEYELRVADDAGCEFILGFTVVEDCELRISFPNAIIPGLEDKNFLAYANEYIDHIEVLIYNRWGELIFYCAHENVESATAFCPWDGTVNGKVVPNGTYPVLVRFKSENQGIEKVIKKAIVVIE